MRACQAISNPVESSRVPRTLAILNARENLSAEFTARSAIMVVMRRVLVWFLFAALALPVLALAAEKDKDDEEMTNLTVIVTTLDGKPVDRARERVQFVKGRSIKKFGKKIIKSWQLKTNQEGEAKIPPLPQGELLVQVIAARYQTYGEIHNVEQEEETIRVTLNPPQQQHSVHQN